MQTALIFLTVSTVTLVFLAGVFRVEDARQGILVVLPRARNAFDVFLRTTYSKLSHIDTYLGRGFARLMLHYAAHGVLQRLLSFISLTEKKVEQLLYRNKQVAKEIRTHKKQTHLDALQEHLEKTALTEAQKKKMRSHE